MADIYTCAKCGGEYFIRYTAQKIDRTEGAIPLKDVLDAGLCPRIPVVEPAGPPPMFYVLRCANGCDVQVAPAWWAP